ncbi:MAG: enoyl-CoA hydratase/isomerase family protein [Acidobacteria bacterium]|nr:enoyl-CoA hydratase/isomerase family protein [Acidobacteriota bacterium]
MSVENASPIVNATLLEDGTLLRLVLDKPKGNVLTLEMMQALSKELDAQSDNPHLRAVVIRGAGKHFSFGASVEEHQKDQAPSMLAGFHAMIRKIVTYPVPVIALVEGSCLGGAFELILACHMVFATPTAVLGCPEIKLGVLPPVLAAIGAKRLGGPLAERLILTGDTIDAATAEKSGMVSTIFSSDNPDEELMAWYQKNLRPLSAFAIRQNTRVARIGSGLFAAVEEPLARIERQYVDEVVASHDGNEGINSFIERRKPVWKDS